MTADEIILQARIFAVRRHHFPHPAGTVRAHEIIAHPRAAALQPLSPPAPPTSDPPSSSAPSP